MAKNDDSGPPTPGWLKDALARALPVGSRYMPTATQRDIDDARREDENRGMAEGCTWRRGG